MIVKTVSATNPKGIRARKANGQEVWCPTVDLCDKTIGSNLNSLIKDLKKAAPKGILHLFMVADSTRVALVVSDEKLATF